MLAQNKRRLSRPVMLAGLIAAMAPAVALGGQNDVVGVAIYFEEPDGSTKPYLFHDINNPLLRWSCEARLDYLTKMFYRMSRTNPDLKGKAAVRSACVSVAAFDFDSQ